MNEFLDHKLLKTSPEKIIGLPEIYQQNYKYFNEDYTFVTNRQEIAIINSEITASYRDRFNSFFVSLTKEGEYIEIWGMMGKLSYEGKEVYRLL